MIEFALSFTYYILMTVGLLVAYYATLYYGLVVVTPRFKNVFVYIAYSAIFLIIMLFLGGAMLYFFMDLLTNVPTTLN